MSIEVGWEAWPAVVSGPIFIVDTRFSRCCLVVRWAGNLEVRDASELIPFSTARELLMEKKLEDRLDRGLVISGK